MCGKSSTILKNLAFSLRLVTSSDCSVVLIKNDSQITFQSYDNNEQRDFLEQRIKLIEWPNLIPYANKISQKSIGCMTIHYKKNKVFLKLLNDSILMATTSADDVDNNDIYPKLDSASNELKTFCNESL